MSKRVIILSDSSTENLADSIAQYLEEGYVRIGDIHCTIDMIREHKNIGHTHYYYKFIQQMEKDI